MEFQIKDGDYVPDGQGGLRTLEGAQEVLARVLFRLKARRGKMPFLPELGSQLYLLLREKPSIRPALARQYVAQALEEETDVTVTEVELTETGDGKAELTVRLEWQGQPLTASLVLDTKT